MPELFREEAVEHHTGRDRIGDVLRVAPAWPVRLLWLLLVLVAAGVALLYVVRVDGDRLLWILLGRG